MWVIYSFFGVASVKATFQYFRVNENTKVFKVTDTRCLKIMRS